MKIVHVTETLVGGVLAALLALSARQAALGHDVSVLYPVKATVPSSDELQARFHPDVHRVELAFRGRVSALQTLRRAIRRLGDDVDVVHLHSTFAGIAGRLGRVAPRGSVVAYSPHGFAFLRESSSRLSNVVALTLERVLEPQCEGLVLVSESEDAVARDRLRGSRRHVLRNGIPVDGLPMASGGASGLPLVVASGRLGEQKGPDRFADIARALAGRAEFVWIGDGSAEARERWIGDAPVRVTGWLPHDQVVAQLAASDVFLFPSRWEGMPISLMEAQVMGVPAVATDIVGNRDVIVDGETGYLCNDVDQMAAAVARLIDDPEERRRLARRARGVQPERLSDSALGPASIGIYQRMRQRTAGVSAAG
ncbi:glycosyltransferase [Microbacterium sp. zg-Y818]|uniref:glycosyltransferase n=1 Tax=unclassified Microbacterium TaxID=2609290 RepID=UPI00214AA18F|nr:MULTISPECIES: glycosyltransferase [unclassified Microbacterium]MCR2802134.1 glycosyltransferase [Microbacterium sp. zg.Y818]WIM22680.1 glycosyltransferase [Microbacterium sp. zg-Y818]